MSSNFAKIVYPKEFNHKAKMRLIEHGDEWKIIGENDSEFLLESVKTGYLKWWLKSHVKCDD